MKYYDMWLLTQLTICEPGSHSRAPTRGIVMGGGDLNGAGELCLRIGTRGGRAVVLPNSVRALLAELLLAGGVQPLAARWAAACVRSHERCARRPCQAAAVSCCEGDMRRRAGRL